MNDWSMVEMKKRIESLDILRGFCMFFAAGGDDLMIALAVAFGFSADCAFARQFKHVTWHGLHFEDCIYPFFVFITGVTWPISLGRQRAKGLSQLSIAKKVVVRGVLLIALGLIGTEFLKFGQFQWASVLGRIGICWSIAALVYAFTPKWVRAVVFWGILISYWLVLLYVPVPGRPIGTDPLAHDFCLVTWINPYICQVPGQYALSTYPMIATALVGMSAGEWLTGGREMTMTRKLLTLACAGLLSSGLGLFWAFGLGPLSFPLNKIVWSSSLVLVTAGISAMLLSFVYWLVDIRGWRRWGFFFKVIGVNCILVYVLIRSFLPFRYLGEYFCCGLACHFPQQATEAIYLAGGVALYWIVLLYLHRHSIYMKV